MTQILGKVKTVLMRSLGSNVTAYVQAVRFAWKIKTNAKSDPEFGLVNKILRVTDVCVDVGANGADWTNHLSRIVGDSGAVYAFEADPYYALATSRATKLLGLRNVKLFGFGLSDQNGHAALNVVSESGVRMSGEGHVDMAATSANESTGNESTGNTAQCRIELRTLDSVAEEHTRLRAVRLIKIDVEGFELFVLRGAAKLLAAARPYVVLEVGNFERYGVCERDIFDFFDAMNYQALTIATGDKLVATDENLSHPDAVGVNRVFVPEERMDAISDLVLVDASVA